MLDAISSAIENIVGFLDTIWQFVVDFTSDTFEMIKLLSDTVHKIPDYFSWLPPEVGVGLIALFSVVVIYKILGREGKIYMSDYFILIINSIESCFSDIMLPLDEFLVFLIFF